MRSVREKMKFYAQLQQIVTIESSNAEFGFKEQINHNGLSKHLKMKFIDGFFKAKKFSSCLYTNKSCIQ
jgi:hypothetical protein